MLSQMNVRPASREDIDSTIELDPIGKQELGRRVFIADAVAVGKFHLRRDLRRKKSPPLAGSCVGDEALTRIPLGFVTKWRTTLGASTPGPFFAKGLRRTIPSSGQFFAGRGRPLQRGSGFIRTPSGPTRNRLASSFYRMPPPPDRKFGCRQTSPCRVLS